MGEEQKRIWEYYMELARIAGTRSDGRKAAYSIEWAYKFYQDEEYQSINEITRAFLGEIDPLSLMDTELDWFNIDEFVVEKGSNPEQKEAILAALSKPVSFIQGPPGTGKSRTILNLMSCIVNGLGNTVAMVSANNAAVGVISEKIKAYGAANDNNADTDVEDYIKHNRENLFSNYAELGSLSVKLKEYNDTHDDFTFRTQKYERLGTSLVCNVSFADFSQRHKAITSTIHSLKKLFSEGPNLQYDYVIMDESSQVNPMLGILAMTSAKHLVLVGDINQLPPIIDPDSIQEADETVPTVLDYYRIQEDYNGHMPSILKMCEARFRDITARVMLKEHFRCHPGIIEFCNCNVYDRQLRIKTANNPLIRIDTIEYKVPIKVLWYQGDYCEPVDISNTDKEIISKRNGKQVTVFVKDELPTLLSRLKDDNDSMESFSVLSPFKGVLTELARSIDNALTEEERETFEIKINDPAEDDDENDKIPIPTLTVHKSQGREFDVIYLLPAEDKNWERPWSQGKNLINVAVSRAKEELRVIVSSELMSSNMQRALTGAENVIPADPNCPENFRYVQKLIDYVKIANESDEEYSRDREQWDPEGCYELLHSDGEHHLNGVPFVFPESNGTSPADFGFFQSSVKSIFDAIPAIRRDAPEVAGEKECPLQCLLNAVFSMPEFVQNNMHLYTDVMLHDFTRADGSQVVAREQLWEMMEHAGYKTPDEYRQWPEHLELHMDAVICDSDRRVLLMIEVDGGFHRFDKLPMKLERQEINDRAKDELIRRYYPGIPFIRLKTDGTSYDEIELIREKLMENAQEDVFCLGKSITKIWEREQVAEKTDGLIRERLIERKPIWKLVEDGISWKAVRSEKDNYTRPRLDGQAVGIVRHYGVSPADGEIYMNAEFLLRFHAH